MEAIAQDRAIARLEGAKLWPMLKDAVDSAAASKLWAVGFKSHVHFHRYNITRKQASVNLFFKKVIHNSYCDPVSFSRAHPRRGCQALKCSSHRGQSQPSRNFPSNGSRSGAGSRQLRQVPPLPSISRAWLPHWLQGSNVVSKVIVLNFFKCHLQTSLAF